MELTTDNLIAAGYKKYEYSPEHPGLHNSDALYQKRIYRDSILLFYIDIWYYDWRRYPQHLGNPDGFMPTVSFAGPHTFDVSLHEEGMTIEEIEAWFTNVYDKLGCVPYED